MKTKWWLLASLGLACGSGKLHTVTGELQVDPLAVDFGKVPLDDKPSKPVELHNTGLGTLKITSISADMPAFAPSVSGPLTLAAGEVRTVDVAFSPAQKGIAHGTLHIEVDAVPTAQVDLTAEVVEEAHQDQHFWVLFDSNRDQGNRDIYAVRPDGTGLKRLTDGPFSEAEPAVSPDGTKLAFSSDREDFTLQLFVMDLATKAVTQVTHATDPSSQPAWSPDGKRLAFHRGIGVYTVAVDGTDEVHVIDGLNAENAYQFASYLPGGNWLLMSRTNEVDMIRTDGTGLRQVVQNDLTQITQPSASPSGSTFAFAAWCTTGLSVRSATTSALTKACSDASEVHFPGRRPAWGPGFIAYETIDSNADIELVPATGGTTIVLSGDPADDRNPAWTPRDTVLP